MQKPPPIYIFGYGSLMERESRLRTTPSAEFIIPVKVTGVARGWWFRGPRTGFTTTFLGTIFDASATCNGILYKVSEGGLTDTDTREKGYVREKLEGEKIKIQRLDGEQALPTGATIWIYNVNVNQKQTPDEYAPIVQSYVDICLKGCLDIRDMYPGTADFAKEFITSTKDWSAHWENDRVSPRRPFLTPRAGEIDELLEAQLKDIFGNIKLPNGQTAKAKL